MADRYMHYGVEVLRQSVDNFRSELNKQGIAYVDLAIAINIDVVMYNTAKGKRYALIRPQSYPDDYAELVYITEQTPDDCNWRLLATDIEGQHNGAEPMRQKTRAKMLLDAAEKVYYDNQPIPDDVFSAVVSMPEQSKMIQDFKIVLAGWGVDNSALSKMEHHDIDEDFWRDLTGGSR